MIGKEISQTFGRNTAFEMWYQMCEQWEHIMEEHDPNSEVLQAFRAERQRRQRGFE